MERDSRVHPDRLPQIDPMMWDLVQPTILHMLSSFDPNRPRAAETSSRVPGRGLVAMEDGLRGRPDEGGDWAESERGDRGNETSADEGRAEGRHVVVNMVLQRMNQAQTNARRGERRKFGNPPGY